MHGGSNSVSNSVFASMYLRLTTLNLGLICKLNFNLVVLDVIPQTYTHTHTYTKATQ
jgi:hypothetical protein